MRDKNENKWKKYITYEKLKFRNITFVLGACQFMYTNFKMYRSLQHKMYNCVF